MKNLSKFDLGMIIAFAVIGLIGGGVWYWQADLAGAAMDDVRTAKAKYDGLSTTGGIVVSPSNEKTLKDNIALLQEQIDPLISDKLNAKGSKLSTIDKEMDSVAWKHDLDDRIRALNKAVKAQQIKVPANNYYFSFSRYTSGNPNDDQTYVLSKQLLAVEQIANILIKAPVKSITSIRRTYEEDPPTAARGGGGGNGRGGAAGRGDMVYGPSSDQPDRLTGVAFKAQGDAYTDYPYEIDFDTSVGGLRQVVDGLMNSPYVFIIRSLSIENEHTTSPTVSSLAGVAGTSSSSVPSVTDSAPGGVAATTVVKGPQYIFDDAILHVKARIDLIEWDASTPDEKGDK